MNQVYRKEKKFLINAIEHYKFTNLLKKVMIQDPHNGANGYIIRSLYFDSLNDMDFEGKEEGIRIRRKIRLRTYDPKLDFAMLEIKQKDGDYQLKRSLRVTREDGIELTKGNYDVLLKYKEPFAAECYGIMNMYCYRPKAVVQYNRKAFIAKENDIRVTFDFNIVTNEANFNIFDDNLVLNGAFNPADTVLEVKYNGFLLSYLKNLIDDVNRSETSVSKYSLSRSTSKYYEFM